MSKRMSDEEFDELVSTVEANSDYGAPFDLTKEASRARESEAELLEACEGMLAILDGTKGRRWDGEFADRCRAAIAKAES